MFICTLLLVLNFDDDAYCLRRILPQVDNINECFKSRGDPSTDAEPRSRLNPSTIYSRYSLQLFLSSLNNFKYCIDLTFIYVGYYIMDADKS